MSSPALLALLAAAALSVCQAQNASSVTSFSSTGSALCFTTALEVDAYSAQCTAASATLDTKGRCAGSIGSYFCSISYSSTAAAVASQSVAYSGQTGLCFDTPYAVYQNAPCFYPDMRVDAAQTGACSGAYSSLYIYYCPSTWNATNPPALSPATRPGVSATCYLTAATCAASCAASGGTCQYDSAVQCAGAGGYNAYCVPPASAAFELSTMGVSCYTFSGCRATYGTAFCVNDPSGVCAGAAGATFTYYGYDDSTLKEYEETVTTSSNNYCYVSAAAALYDTGCTSAVQADPHGTGGCATASAGYMYFCPLASAPFTYATNGIECFPTATACNAYFTAGSCVSDAGACAGAAAGSTLYSRASSNAFQATSSAASSDGQCYVTLAATEYWTDCTNAQDRQDSGQSVCADAAPFVWYCPTGATSAAPRLGGAGRLLALAAAVAAAAL